MDSTIMVDPLTTYYKYPILNRIWSIQVLETLHMLCFLTLTDKNPYTNSQTRSSAPPHREWLSHPDQGAKKKSIQYQHHMRFVRYIFNGEMRLTNICYIICLP